MISMSLLRVSVSSHLAAIVLSFLLWNRFSVVYGICIEFSTRVTQWLENSVVGSRYYEDSCNHEKSKHACSVQDNLVFNFKCNGDRTHFLF